MINASSHHVPASRGPRLVYGNQGASALERSYLPLGSHSRSTILIETWTHSLLSTGEMKGSDSNGEEGEMVRGAELTGLSACGDHVNDTQ